MCGSCAMMVNGAPRWTCRTHAAKVAKDGKLRLAPLRNMPVIKDLAADMTVFFDKWQTAGGRFVPSEPGSQEFASVAPDSKERKAASAGIECIGCGVCYAACDVVSWNPDYLGPGAAQPGLDAGQRRAGRRPQRASGRRRGGRRLPRLPQPPELHDLLPQGAEPDCIHRGPEARDPGRRAEG